MSEKYPQTTTPRGVFIYPHLTEADTKYVKPDGEYHTKFALGAADETTEDFIDTLQGVMDDYIKANPDELKPAALKRAARADFFEEEIDDEGEETGRLIFKFKLKAKVVTKTKEWDQRVRLFDSGNPAKGIKPQPIDPESVNIWTGSEGKVTLELYPYFMQTSKTFGVSLRCLAVQVLKLVEGTGKDAAGYGFGTEDDGYVADDSDSGFVPEEGGEDDDVEF